MKKSLINLRIIAASLLFSFFLSNSNAQIQEKCASGHIHQNLLQSDPAYAQRVADFEAYVQSIQNNPTTKAAATYRVPVVVHVMHKGEAVGTGTNVSDQVIRTAIQNLNNMYRKVPGTQGDGNGVDVDIEFVLAVRNPQGQCTNGINRVSMTNNTTYMNSGVSSGSGAGISDASLKAIVSWDRTKYYNIYLVSEIDNNNGGAGVQGYAYTASSHGTSVDGAVILASNFLSQTSTTAAHELGHAFNLLHTFEGDGTGSTCPPTGANQGDMCGDTPPHRRSQSDCNVTGTNSCNNNSSNALFVRNYMDYSSETCQNMFTANQKTRMNAACTGQRASFFNANNLALVPISAPVVDFTASQNILCGTGTVKFTDMSGCVPNSYLSNTSWSGITFSWTFSNGSTNLSSTDQNPTMTFTQTGAYDVTLTVTSSAGTATLTKEDFVVVSGNPVTACTPTSQNAGNFGQTVSNVNFNTISNSTSSLSNVAFTNFVCTNNTIVESGQAYTLSVTGNAGPTGAERVEVYIDYNNNGQFENPSELVLSGSVPAGSQSALSTQTFTQSITIPATATQNTLLRMRVMGNLTSISAANRSCSSAFTLGDVEDYGIYIKGAGCTTAPSITAQPINKSICAGSNTTFAITASGASSYQWQVSTNGGTSWTNVTNGGIYSTATTATLTITGATVSNNNSQYRCITTNTCGTTNTSAGTLTVTASPTITNTTPGSRCGTGTVNLSATASAGTISWYTVTTGGTAVGTGASFTTPSISATTTYYVQTASGNCTSTRTAVQATVTPNASMAALPSQVCVNANAFTLTQGSPAGGTYSGTGVSGTTFSPSQAGAGTHTVTYTYSQNNCTTTATGTITVNSCLSIDEEQQDIFVLYPNPTDGFMKVKGEKLELYQSIELRDIAGRLVATWEIQHQKEMTLDLSIYAEGNYQVRILGKSNEVVKQVQIKK